MHKMQRKVGEWVFIMDAGAICQAEVVGVSNKDDRVFLEWSARTETDYVRHLEWMPAELYW